MSRSYGILHIPFLNKESTKDFGHNHDNDNNLVSAQLLIIFITYSFSLYRSIKFSR